MKTLVRMSWCAMLAVFAAGTVVASPLQLAVEGDDFREAKPRSRAPRADAVTSPAPFGAAGGTPDIPVSVATGDQGNQASIPDGDGGAIVAWQDTRHGGSDIYAHRVLSSGQVDPTWPVNGLALCLGAQATFVLGMVGDGAGGAIVVWEDATTKIRAQHVLNSGAVDPAWGPTGVTVATTAAGTKLLNAITDRAGGAFVAWRDLRNGTSDIYAMHLTTTGVDPAWPVNGLAVCTAPSNQTSPVMCADGATGAIVVWADLRTPANSYDLYAQHILVNGTVDPAWPVNGAVVVARPLGQRLYSTANFFVIDSQSSDHQGEAVISDGAGGCLVAWTEGNTLETQDIYVHRMLATGIVNGDWPAGGVVVCNAPGPQGLAYLTGDAAGGAVITWIDGRAGGADPFFGDIYARLVDRYGYLYGPTNGLAVLTGGSGSYPTTTTDGSNGTSVFWTDRRDSVATGYEVYAHHLLVAPSLAVDGSFPANGRALTDAAGDQDLPTAVWNAASGAIVTWNDSRNSGVTGVDLYAELLNKGTTDVSWATLPKLVLGAGSPNPFRDAMRIRFELPQTANVRLDVLDLGGRRVRTLVSGTCPAGRHDASWDGRDDEQRSVSAGVYFVTIRAHGGTATRRIVRMN